ncbi:MAG: hypothetical protein R2751_11655 [Bacteroidales bacterium]
MFPLFSTLQSMNDTPKRSIRDLVNTPFKRVVFALQILSYFLIVGSPLIGGFAGRALGLNTGRTAGLVLGVFIAGEVLFYGTLAILGKELVLILRDTFKAWFRRKKRDEGNP